MLESYKRGGVWLNPCPLLSRPHSSSYYVYYYCTILGHVVIFIVVYSDRVHNKPYANSLHINVDSPYYYWLVRCICDTFMLLSCCCCHLHSTRRISRVMSLCPCCDESSLQEMLTIECLNPENWNKTGLCVHIKAQHRARHSILWRLLFRGLTSVVFMKTSAMARKCD